MEPEGGVNPSVTRAGDLMLPYSQSSHATSPTACQAQCLLIKACQPFPAVPFPLLGIKKPSSPSLSVPSSPSTAVLLPALSSASAP